MFFDPRSPSHGLLQYQKDQLAQVALVGSHVTKGIVLIAVDHTKKEEEGIVVVPCKTAIFQTVPLLPRPVPSSLVARLYTRSSLGKEDAGESDTAEVKDPPPAEDNNNLNTTGQGRGRGRRGGRRGRGRGSTMGKGADEVKAPPETPDAAEDHPRRLRSNSRRGRGRGRGRGKGRPKKPEAQKRTSSLRSHDEVRVLCKFFPVRSKHFL